MIHNPVANFGTHPLDKQLAVLDFSEFRVCQNFQSELTFLNVPQKFSYPSLVRGLTQTPTNFHYQGFVNAIIHCYVSEISFLVCFEQFLIVSGVCFISKLRVSVTRYFLVLMHCLSAICSRNSLV